MSGLLDNCQWPSCEFLKLSERRNIISAVTAGVLFSVGWWIVIDAAATYPKWADFNHAYHTPGVISVLAFFMINSVSNGQIRGESYNSGFLGQRGARVWLFLGFLLGFGAVIVAAWILFQVYVFGSAHPAQWPGVAIFLQNALIFFSSIVFKFGRTEDLWG